jgi:hypothetical protein
MSGVLWGIQILGALTKEEQFLYMKKLFIAPANDSREESNNFSGV